MFHRIHALSTSWKFTQYASFFAARALRQLSIAPNLTIPALIACRWGRGIVRLVRSRSCALIIVLLLTHSLTGSIDKISGTSTQQRKNPKRSNPFLEHVVRHGSYIPVGPQSMIINYIPGTFSDPCNSPITPIFHHDGLSHGTESRIRTNYAPPGLTIPVVIRTSHVLTMELFSFMLEPTLLFRGKLFRARQDDFQTLEYLSCKIGFF